MNRLKQTLVVFGVIIFCGVLDAATRYDGDGELSGRLEEVRWHINRTRYAPEQEADRLYLTNTATGGSPDYDVCEDITGTNNFGTNAAAWAPWIITKPPLAPNALLSRCASNHSRDMAETGIFQHNSPSSNYYPLSNSPSQRATAEVYNWSASGENIVAGTDWWMTPALAHETLFIDDGYATRGHRKNILDYSYAFREIGLGAYAGGGWYYYTEDFGRSGAVHFLTCTMFYDSNSDGVYNSGEGVSNIEVRVWRDGVEGASYDVSTASGNFAVPITDLTDGSKVNVQFVNKNSSSRQLSVPFTFNNMGSITLTGSEQRIVGYYTQPTGATNVGFRNIVPIYSNTIFQLSGSTAGVTVAGFKSARYILQRSTDLATGSWANVTSYTAAAETHVISDTNASAPRAFYRVRLE